MSATIFTRRIATLRAQLEASRERRERKRAKRPKVPPLRWMDEEHSEPPKKQQPAPRVCRVCGVAIGKRAPGEDDVCVRHNGEAA